MIKNMLVRSKHSSKVMPSFRPGSEEEKLGCGKGTPTAKVRPGSANNLLKFHGINLSKEQQPQQCPEAQQPLCNQDGQNIESKTDKDEYQELSVRMKVALGTISK